MERRKTERGYFWRTLPLLESLSLVLFGLAFFLGMALFTFHPEDPSFSRTAPPGWEVQNSGGVVGAYVADLLAQLFGLSAWVIPLASLWVGLFWIRHRFAKNPVSLGLGLTLAGATVAIFVRGLVLVDPFFGPDIQAGGLLGGVLAPALFRYFGGPGGYLILLLAASVAVLLLARRVLVQVRSGLILGLKAFPVAFQTLVARIRKWRSEKVRVEKEEIKFAEPPVRPQVSEVSLGEPDRGEAPPSPAITLPPDISKASSGKRPPHTLPSLSLLEDPPPALSGVAREELTQRSALLEEKLRDYGVEGRVLQVLHGPVVTMFEFSPAAGIKVSKIANLSDDLALAMRALAVRIVAPIPGKAAVGIEIPNSVRQPVALKEILASEEFHSQQGQLPLALGKDILGRPVITDLAQIPHLLIAGATGSGKSVGINAMVCSLLFRVSPEEAKFIMIDPKMLELSVYEGIPHLLAPVVTNPKRAALALRGVIEEMERRYALLADKGVRNVEGYNTLIAMKKPETSEEEEPLPYIVVVIDELADLMMVSSREVEDSLTRLAQMARAAGIHLLVATQRPSVDVLTGLIKANFPARISFQVSSKTDSRTILDANGAERLLGRGDMLFLPPGTSHLARIHGAFVSEQEISRVTEFLKKQGAPVYDDFLFLPAEQAQEEETEVEDDEKYQEAVELVARSRQASISMVQRRLRVGYNRAARMIERMEKEGLVSPSDGVKPREVYVTPKEA